MREEEKQTKNGGSKFKRSLRKKWVFPAIYIASAAIILSGVLWFQSTNNQTEAPENYSYEDPDKQAAFHEGNEAVPVNVTEENVAWPVLDEKSVFVQTPYYDDNASEENQEAALVFYNNTYYQNKGVDFAMKGDKTFDVVASLSGSVVKAEKDEILGYVVQLKHENGITTRYNSLENVNVEVGDNVDQGDVIGTAGRNVYNQDAGIHVHFEVRKDGEPMNPISFFNKPVSSLLEEPKEASDQVVEEEPAQEEDSQDGNQESEEKSEETPDEDQNADDSEETEQETSNNI